MPTTITDAATTVDAAPSHALCADEGAVVERRE
jgi:hypothetical protein